MELLSSLVWHVVQLSIFIRGVSMSGGLKWVRVNVPQYRVPGETALLQCDYDLGNDTLYAVKWYKEHEEFYRFVPKVRPQATSYKVEGVHVDSQWARTSPGCARAAPMLPCCSLIVDATCSATNMRCWDLPNTERTISTTWQHGTEKMSKSNNRKVVLHPVSWKTSGLFRCEVSAEAPSFASAQSEARMEVVSLPQEDPIITGVEMQYQIGDEIVLNCTSGKSHPGSVLHWYINEQQVVSPEALIRYPPVQHRQGLVSTTLGLRFILSSRHFQGGSMKVKCVASVSPVLWRGDRESVVQSLPIKDMREALLLVKSSTTNIRISGLAFAVNAIVFVLLT